MKKIIILLLIPLSLLVRGQKIAVPADAFPHRIFAGDHPDPSILVDGDDYYIVHSSFDYYPGLLIWHSKDLLNWQPLVNALHKYVGSVWAPDLVKYGNKYYIYFPANNTNYVVTADKITGPWSDPVDLKIGNIDPGHIADAAEVELEITGDAIGGLVLFYNNNSYYGILSDKEDILANLRGYQFPTVHKAIDKHVFLKVENHNHIVNMFYSLDGLQWLKIENSAEVSGLHHNALGGFLSLRIGLCSIGNGSVLYHHFKYQPL